MIIAISLVLKPLKMLAFNGWTLKTDTLSGVYLLQTLGFLKVEAVRRVFVISEGNPRLCDSQNSTRIRDSFSKLREISCINHLHKERHVQSADLDPSILRPLVFKSPVSI